MWSLIFEIWLKFNKIFYTAPISSRKYCYYIANMSDMNQSSCTPKREKSEDRVSRAHSQDALDSSSASSLSFFADHSDTQNSGCQANERNVDDQKSGECSPRWLFHFLLLLNAILKLFKCSRYVTFVFRFTRSTCLQAFVILRLANCRILAVLFCWSIWNRFACSKRN